MLSTILTSSLWYPFHLTFFRCTHIMIRERNVKVRMSPKNHRLRRANFSQIHLQFINYSKHFSCVEVKPINSGRRVQLVLLHLMISNLAMLSRSVWPLIPSTFPTFHFTNLSWTLSPGFCTATDWYHTTSLTSSFVHRHGPSKLYIHFISSSA